jgi:hypothetical protein
LVDQRTVAGGHRLRGRKGVCWRDGRILGSCRGLDHLPAGAQVGKPLQQVGWPVGSERGTGGRDQRTQQDRESDKSNKLSAAHHEPAPAGYRVSQLPAPEHNSVCQYDIGIGASPNLEIINIDETKHRYAGALGVRLQLLASDRLRIAYLVTADENRRCEARRRHRRPRVTAGRRR